jgi:HK97 family phage major capsid protein
MGSFFQALVGEEFAFQEDSEIFEGTGVGQCLGIKKSDAAIEVEKETGQEAGTFLYENAVNMWARLHVRSRFNSFWAYNQELEPQLMMLNMVLGTSSAPVYLPPGGASATPYATLFGRPMLPIEHADVPGTKGDISLVDMNQYLLASKGGLKSDVSMHVRFLQGEQALRFTKRNNGMPAWKKSLMPYKGTKKVSPFIFLEDR